jgi:uncharacterized metal-binding protein
MSDAVCERTGDPTLLFACSGAADVGQVADLAARKLSADGIGKMFCLAGVGGRVAPIMQTAHGAQRILAIDGCPLDCARSCLEQAGFLRFLHVRVTDLGMAKGRSPATDDNVKKVAAKAASLLR